jgi:hypothetical protein
VCAIKVVRFTALSFREVKLRGQKSIPHSLDVVIQQTLRLWRKHHLGYDQTKYVVERVRHRLALEPAYTRKRIVSRLQYPGVGRKAVVGGCAFDGLYFAEILAFARLG